MHVLGQNIAKVSQSQYCKYVFCLFLFMYLFVPQPYVIKTKCLLAVDTCCLQIRSPYAFLTLHAAPVLCPNFVYTFLALTPLITIHYILSYALHLQLNTLWPVALNYIYIYIYIYIYTHFIIPYGNIIFDIGLCDLCPHFLKQS
jgi:hypothetical protein